MTFGFGFGFPRSQGIGAFSPAALFASGEQGAWYDPSDLTTLFQDTAGTTPITTPGQVVARINDKSGQGNHATQATTASRPTYGIVPATGRRNLLLQSQSIQSSPWVGFFVTGASSTVLSPDGVTFAAAITGPGDTGTSWSQTYSSAPIGTYTFSLWLRADSSFNTSMTVGSTVLTISVTTSWQRFSVTTTTASTANLVASFRPSTTGGVTRTVYAWGAQLETGSTATAYQRVGATQWDVTEAGVQSLSYLSFDGVDDGMTTASFSWPGLYSVWAGARPGRVTGVQILANMDGGAGIERLPQFLRLNTSNPESIGFVAGSPFSDQGPAVAANTSYVLSANTLSSQINVRTNAVANAATSFTGSLNTASRALTIGMFDLAFPGSYFLGNLYGLILRGAATDATNITNTETWLNGKTGAY